MWCLGFHLNNEWVTISLYINWMTTFQFMTALNWLEIHGWLNSDKYTTCSTYFQGHQYLYFSQRSCQPHCHWCEWFLDNQNLKIKAEQLRQYKIKKIAWYSKCGKCTGVDYGEEIFAPLIYSLTRIVLLSLESLLLLPILWSILIIVFFISYFATLHYQNI